MKENGETFKRNLLRDMRVELKEEFDRNFERKAFFSDRWKQRQNPNAKGTLLAVTGTLRRSIRSEVRGNGVRFSSAVPYAAIHNEGGKGTKTVRSHLRKGRSGKVHAVRSHTRRFAMPERRFIGDGRQTRKIIEEVINDHLKKFNVQLTNVLKQ